MSQNSYARTNNIPAAKVSKVQAAIAGTLAATTGPIMVSESLTNVLQVALIAEDIGTAFYYTGLTSAGVITDTALAGPSGTATSPNPTPGQSDAGNIGYLRSALFQEISHANTLRQLLNPNYNSQQAASAYVYDPYQILYFNPASFTSLSNFLSELNFLENVFIAAYHIAVDELTALAFNAGFMTVRAGVTPASFYAGAAQLAAEVMFVEGEHRVLGQVIGQNCNVLTDYEGGNTSVDAVTGLSDMNSAQSLLLKYVNGSATNANYTLGVSLGTVITGAPSIWIAQ